MPEESLLLRLKVEGGKIVADEVRHADEAVGKYDRTAARAHDTTGRLGGAFSNLRSMAALALGASGIGGLAFGLADAVKNSEKLQAAQAQAGAAIKAAHDHTRNATEAMTNFGDSLAMRGGFTTPEELQAMTQFERITRNVAKSQQELGLATNLARGAHLSLERATRVVIMAEAGHTSMLARLGIILPKHATALQAVTALQNRYAGSTAAYSHTAQGAYSNLSNLVEILTAKLGTLLLPTLMAVFHWLTQFVTQVENGTGAGGQFRAVAESIAGVLGTVWKWVKSNALMLAELTGVVLAGVAAWKAYEIITTVIKGVETLITLFNALKAGTLAETAAQMELNTAFFANPIGLVIVAIAGLVAGIVIAYNKIGWFRNMVDGVWTWMKGAVVGTIHFISEHWQQIGSVLASPFVTVANFIGHAFTGVKGVVIDILNFIIARVNDVISVLDSLHVSTPFGDIGVPHIAKLGLLSTGSPGGTSPTHGVTGAVAAHGHRAYGGPVNYGGVYNVGEHGREQVHLPAGSHVDAHPNNSGEIVIHNHVHIDGREAGLAIVRAGAQQAALR